MKNEIIFVVSLVSLVFLSISIGYLATDDINSLMRKINKVETLEQCNNLTLIETAHCLNDYICSIYKFKERKDSENPTLQELIEEGGDCKNWAELYIGYAEELNFYAKMVVINTGKGFAHAFAVISDETGYCILDQMNLDCYRLD